MSQTNEALAINAIRSSTGTTEKFKSCTGVQTGSWWEESGVRTPRESKREQERENELKSPMLPTFPVLDQDLVRLRGVCTEPSTRSLPLKRRLGCIVERKVDHTCVRCCAGERISAKVLLPRR